MARTSAPLHQTLRSVAANPELLYALSARERDELLRRLKELEALEKRALLAYDSGDLALAEELDAEYAERAEELEGLEAMFGEGVGREADMEPGELDRRGVGKYAPPVHLDLTAQLSELYSQYVLYLEDPRTTLHDLQRQFDPEYVTETWAYSQEGLPFPINTPEDGLAFAAKRLIEADYQEREGKRVELAHVPASQFVEAAEDAFDRRSDLRERYREAQERKLVGNRPRHPLPRTREVFDELMDKVEAGPFDDFGWISLKADQKAGNGGARQFAYCMSKDGNVSIAFAPKAEDLPRPNLVGLMAHELGHAIDFRYPRAVIIERLGLHGLPHGAERRADVIAEHVFGIVIEYDDDDVQCVGCGGRSPRPAHLAKNPDDDRVPFYEGRVIELGSPHTVEYLDEEGNHHEQPVYYRVRVSSDRDFRAEAYLDESAPMPAGGTAIDKRLHRRIGSVGAEFRDYDLYDAPVGVMAVYGSGVHAGLRRQGIGSNLYALAADVSCRYFSLPFASDTSYSTLASDRWEGLGAASVFTGDDYEDPDVDVYLLECLYGGMSDFDLPIGPRERRPLRRRRRA